MAFVEGTDGALAPIDFSKGGLRGSNIILDPVKGMLVSIEIEGGKGRTGITISGLADGAWIQDVSSVLKGGEERVVSVAQKKPGFISYFPVRGNGISWIVTSIFWICGRAVNKTKGLICEFQCAREWKSFQRLYRVCASEVQEILSNA
jgi:hypothetical protein